MGINDYCGSDGGGTAKTSFSVVLWAALAVAMKTLPTIFLSVPFGGIPTTVDLLAPAVPPTIKPREPTFISFNY